MKSSKPGPSTSQAEVTHISKHNVWLLARGQELFMPYETFPWFKDASVKKILNVEELTPGHYA